MRMRRQQNNRVRSPHRPDLLRMFTDHQKTMNHGLLRRFSLWLVRSSDHVQLPGNSPVVLRRKLPHGFAPRQNQTSPPIVGSRPESVVGHHGRARPRRTITQCLLAALLRSPTFRGEGSVVTDESASKRLETTPTNRKCRRTSSRVTTIRRLSFSDRGLVTPATARRQVTTCRGGWA